MLMVEFRFGDILGIILEKDFIFIESGLGFLFLLPKRVRTTRCLGTN